MPVRSRRRRILYRLMYPVYLVLLCWGGIELFWWIQFGDVESKSSVELVWRHYYRELWRSGALEAQPSLDDESFDVLLLGGSVLDHSAPDIEQALTARMQRPVRVYNLAKAAHNSLDSRNKFSRLSDKPFDCIVIYHGINDIPMNYVPREKFRADYSHVNWYAGFKKRIAAGRLNFKNVSLDAAQGLVDRVRPREENREYGSDIKTVETFTANYRTILEPATRNGSLVVLMQFAWYLPEGYTKERYLAKELDYALGGYEMPADDWGRPQDIPVILERHNEAIVSLAREFDTLLIDQQTLMETDAGRGPLFEDVCHFSPAGRKLFAENLVSELMQHVRE